MAHRILLRPLILGAALLAALLAGCSDDEPGFIPPVDTGGGGGSDSTVFAGFLLDPHDIGRLDITIESISLAPRRPFAPAGPRWRAPLAPAVGEPTVAARGRLQGPGGTIYLTGIYNFSADTLYLTGQGRVLRGNFVGIGNTGGISGNATTPAGAAAFLTGHDASKPWAPWCGTFRATATADSGTFGFIRADTLLAGMAFQVGANAALFFDGEVSKGGTPKTLFIDSSFSSLFDATGSGTLDDGTGMAGGNYAFIIANANYGTTNGGTWSATRR